MSEVETDLPETEQAAEVTGLDAHISKAMENFGAPETAVPEGEKPAQTAEERARDEKGRFAPKESKTDAKPSDGASKAPEQIATDQQSADPLQEQIAPHARWNEARKAAFNSLPPEAKKLALEIQAEHEANFTRKSQEDADYRRSADPIVQAVQPFADYLKQIGPVTGQTPGQMINGLLAAEYQLRTGDLPTKYQAIAQIAQSYGVDLAALSRGQIAQPDPLITQLRQQVSDLTNRLGSFEQQTTQQQDQANLAFIDSFATAKDEKGAPKYPLFEQVRVRMGPIVAKQERVDLDAAYQEAIKPFQAYFAQDAQARIKQADEARQAAVDKAKKVAPVKSSGTAPNGTTKSKGLDSILSEAMAQHGM